MSLKDLREALNDLDRQLLELAAKRRSLAQQIGATKQRAGQATRDFAREREVLERARTQAARLDLAPELAEGLLRLLIEDSLTAQEADRVAQEGVGGGRRALVIGGAGGMGSWFVRFLRSQGFQVEVADPHLPPVERPLDHELVIVATPLRITNAVLHELAPRQPTGVVFDIGSLKSPLKSGIQALLDHGVRATSLHPMFGPDARLLSGRHVILCEVGAPGATQIAEALFAPTMATTVRMDLAEHDRLMAYVLGLSHALNIAFSTALAGSGELAGRLASASSTTFDAQLEVARRVSSESPDLYYDIQALNDYGLDALDALDAAVQRLRAAIAQRDADTFRDLMRSGRIYLQQRTPPR